jgi:hypothetical protein
MTTKRSRSPAKPVIDPSLELAVTEKLRSSGLDFDDARALGIDVLDKHAVRSLHPSFDLRPAIKIPYFRPDDPISALRCGQRPPFYRLRYLTDPPAGPFGERELKPRRYTNEPRMGVCAYFPRLTDWPALIADVDRPLIITEGELKAACATKHGFPTIGLGGVFNYASKELDLPFLDELDLVCWLGRAVYIVYDSDLASNSNVCLALNRLARKLQQHGANVLVGFLPSVTEGGKTGLDDFIVHQGSDELKKLLAAASPMTTEQVLHQMNDHNVFIYESASIWSTLTLTNQPVKGFFDAYAAKVFERREVKVDKDGLPVLTRKPMPAAKAWIEWPLRREAGKLSYEPGMPPGLVDHESGYPEMRRWNVWSGWPVEPQRGDIDPFMTLIDHVFKDVDESVKRWFLSWVAWPLQFPGTKLYSAVVIHGRLHGTGKSLLGETVGKLYGENFTIIGNEELHGKYNGWAARKQFILGDEITGSDRRTLQDKIKRMITQTRIRIDNKYEKAYELRDCVNYLFTSNRANAFMIDDDDRRLLIHEMPEDVVLDEEKFFKREYETWIDSRQGQAALLDYLLKYDVCDFNPNGRAPMTVAKQQMIYHSKSDLGAWVMQLRESPDQLLLGAAQDLFTNGELLAYYQGADVSGRDKVTAQGMGNALRDAGFVMANKGQPMRGPGSVGRYYVIRNPEKWRSASVSELGAHLKDPKPVPREKVTPIKKTKY